MKGDISNREIKETIQEMRASFKEQNDSLRYFIEQTNVNVKSLNDNQLFHNQEMVKLNNKLELWAKLTSGLIPKVVWIILILIAIILFMAGYTFLFEKIVV